MSSPDGQVSGMTWSAPGLACLVVWCHPVDLPVGYHAVSRGGCVVRLPVGWWGAP
jgi:hypothetical protein